MKPKKPVLAVKKSLPQGPFSVKKAWQRIEAWCKKEHPDFLNILNPGATAAEIHSFEKAIGRKLPTEVQESYRIHDGQKERHGNDFYPGIIFGILFLSLKDSLREWQMWKDVAEDIKKEPLPELGSEYEGMSFPRAAIRIQYVDLGWIPVCAWFGDQIGIDLDPAPHGTVGQVITFGRDQEEKFVLAISWGQFLEDVAEELERGNFRTKDKAGETTFRLREPDVDNFLTAAGAWSLAKLGVNRLSPEDAKQPAIQQACDLLGWDPKH